MEIVFTEKDKEIVEQFRNGEMSQIGITLPFLSDDTKKCSLELEINDPFKCAIFLSRLIYDLRDYTKEECGFDISAISLIGVHSDLNNLNFDIMNAVKTVLEKHNL